MTRPVGSAQLEEPNMCRPLNIAKIPNGIFSRYTTEQTQYQLNKLLAEVGEANTRGVGFLGHNQVKAALERHPAMICQKQSDNCLQCKIEQAGIPTYAGSIMLLVLLHHSDVDIEH
jgi:hypothetical protein